VEDSAAEARLAREALRETAFPVRLHIASDGVEAMDFLYRRGEYRDAPRADLVLLDLNLPRKDGREVLRDIKADAELRRIPVVVLTTSQAPSDIKRAYELYANCYIQKPLELDGFIEIVKSIHRYWLQTAELPI
jgi:CheY-like chemotaxis protein